MQKLGGDPRKHVAKTKIGGIGAGQYESGGEDWGLVLMNLMLTSTQAWGKMAGGCHSSQLEEN